MKHLLFFCALLAASLQAEPARPSVVLIEGRLGDDAPEATNRALGFITEEDGFLLTNYENLLNPADQRLLPNLTARLDGERSFPARVIGVDPTLGLGILKIESEQTFVPSILVRGQAPIVDSAVFAFSEFKEGEWKLEEGRVTALNTRECYQENLTSTMFKTNLDVSPGLGGGPVFNAEGGVIAIHTGFVPEKAEGHIDDDETDIETHVLPITLCLNIYESIKHKKSHESPWTGFSVRALNEKEQKLFPTAKRHKGGIAIEHVWPNSPAEKLGIQVDDILVQFSHNRIESVADFQKWLYMYGVGHPVKLVILRDGKDYLVTDYIIEERPTWARPR
ncbi:MAG: S1C family serine protease [Verrucomicrobiota bacterium JB023]|nr:S1C family serine protease [Verrucomicrobiota bacterium JB023]